MIIEWNVLFVEKIFFVTSPMGLTDFRSTACKHYWKWDVTNRYRHIELIWRLSMVQYLQNNVIMKWTTRFTSFNGWIPLKYGSTTTPPIIAHGQNLRCQQVEAGPIFSGHWIPYLFFRTSPDIIGYWRCPDFSGHVRRPTQLPKLTRLLTSAISVAI